MNKTFCPQCGTKNEYSTQKPNFCYNCGQSFGRAQASVSPPPSVDGDDDDFVDDGEIPSIDNVKPIVQLDKTSFTLRDLAGTSSPEEAKRNRLSRRSSVSLKEYRKSIQPTRKD